MAFKTARDLHATFVRLMVEVEQNLGNLKKTGLNVDDVSGIVGVLVGFEKNWVECG